MFHTTALSEKAVPRSHSCITFYKVDAPVIYAHAQTARKRRICLLTGSAIDLNFRNHKDGGL